METGDAKRRKYYKQVFLNNMSDKREPEIGPNPSGLDFTCVSFRPDLKKLGMETLDGDIIALMTKRVYDMAGVTPERVKVQLNGQPI